MHMHSCTMAGGAVFSYGERREVPGLPARVRLTVISPRVDESGARVFRLCYSPLRT